MNTYNKYYPLIQTFVELDAQIAHLTKTISSDRFIEIGDNPRLVQEIETTLTKLHSKAISLEPYFDLAKTPLSKANIYFALLKHLGDTLKFLQEVRKRNYGSLRHTQKLLGKLRDCSNSIYAIGELVTVNTGPIQ